VIRWRALLERFCTSSLTISHLLDDETRFY
jgi:hypothetical protein